jgi:hypothetical protein
MTAIDNLLHFNNSSALNHSPTHPRRIPQPSAT